MAQVSARIDRLVSNNPKVKAYASATLYDAYAFHGITVREGEHGIYVRLPKTRMKDENGNIVYRDRFHPITAQARAELWDAVLNAYHQALDQQHQPEQTQFTELPPDTQLPWDVSL